MPQRTAAQEWREGWTLVLASFIGFMGFSTMIAAMSAFMGPLAAEFGWGRTLLSAGSGLSSIVMALLSPVFGIFLDRYGARRLALPGIVISGLAVVAMATNTGSAAYWIALWMLYATGALFVNTPVWTLAVSGMFERARGLALAIALAGATAAHSVFPPLSVWLIDVAGWRMAFVWLGLGSGAVAFVFCYFFFFDARDRERTAPRVDKPGKAGDAAPLPGLSLAEAWRSTALWRIGASILIIMLLTIGFLIHQIEILVETGVARTNAAWLAMVAGAMGVVGKLVTGFLIDRLPGSWVGGITMGFAAIAFYVLVGGAASSLLVFLAMLVNGYTAGAKLHIASYLTVQYAGLRNFGKIYGLISSLVAIGSGMGPIVAGLVYDLSGSYEAFLMGGAVALAVSALLLATLPRYPDWSERKG